MPRTIISVLIILFLGGALVMFALRGCESPSEPPVDTIEYENTHEETAPSHEGVQYHSVELPETGGLRI